MTAWNLQREIAPEENAGDGPRLVGVDMESWLMSGRAREMLVRSTKAMVYMTNATGAASKTM